MTDVIPEALTAEQIAAGQAATAATRTNERTFTEADIQKARQEEKDKLYGRLSSLEERLNSTLDETKREREEREAVEATRSQAEAEARKHAEEEELSAKDLINRRQSEFQKMLEEKEQNWKSQLEQEQQARKSQEALLAKERDFSDLRDYTQVTVEANKEKIAPQLLSWIKGNSREEIDESVARAVATTDSLVQDLNQVRQDQQSTMIGTRSTAGPTDFDAAASPQTLTNEQIANMDMSTYAKYRSRLIGDSGQNNKGLYG